MRKHRATVIIFISRASSVVPIIGSAIGNSRLLGNFVTIGIGGFQSYSISLII